MMTTTTVAVGRSSRVSLSRSNEEREGKKDPGRPRTAFARSGILEVHPHSGTPGEWKKGAKWSISRRINEFHVLSLPNAGRGLYRDVKYLRRIGEILHLYAEVLHGDRPIS